MFDACVCVSTNKTYNYTEVGSQFILRAVDTKESQFTDHRNSTMKAGTRDIFILSILVALYLFLGAGIFHVLERPSHSSQENTIDEVIDSDTLEELRKNLSVNMSKSEFDKLVKKIHEFHYNRRVTASSHYNWTYSGALYFSASVITTIGKSVNEETHQPMIFSTTRFFLLFYIKASAEICTLTVLVPTSK